MLFGILLSGTAQNVMSRNEEGCSPSVSFVEQAATTENPVSGELTAGRACRVATTAAT